MFAPRVEPFQFRSPAPAATYALVKVNGKNSMPMGIVERDTTISGRALRATLVHRNRLHLLSFVDRVRLLAPFGTGLNRPLVELNWVTRILADHWRQFFSVAVWRKELINPRF